MRRSGAADASEPESAAGMGIRMPPVQVEDGIEGVLCPARFALNQARSGNSARWALVARPGRRCLAAGPTCAGCGGDAASGQGGCAVRGPKERQQIVDEARASLGKASAAGWSGCGGFSCYFRVMSDHAQTTRPMRALVMSPSYSASKSNVRGGCSTALSE